MVGEACVKQYRWKMVGVTLGFAAGAWLGSSVGIAALGSAISGMVPIGLMGSYVGYRLAKRLDK